MTTIAYKGGIMAADRLSYLGKFQSTHARKSKIHRLEDGSLLGISTGVVGAAAQLQEWIEQGYPADADIVSKSVPDSFEILLVRPDGSMVYWNDGFWPQTIESDIMAIGSGSSYALGALEVGATAMAAVRAASRFDPFTCSEFENLHLETADAPQAAD